MFGRADVFNASAAPTLISYISNAPAHTPYIAVQMDDAMVKTARTHIPPVFADDGTGVIPHCWYQWGLEAPSPRPSIRVVGDVNNFDQLQILLLEVDGKRLRPDGVPYHTIWSYDDPQGHDLVEDARYPWSVRVFDDMPKIDKQTLSLVFAATTKTVLSTRVMEDVEQKAEQLATAAYDASRLGVLENNDDFDFHPVDLKLEYISTLFPPLRRVEYVGGRRHSLDVGW